MDPARPYLRAERSRQNAGLTDLAVAATAGAVRLMAYLTAAKS